MSVSADTLRLHLDYTAWATRRLLDTVANLSAEDLARDFKTSDKTVLDTLAHVFAADRVWLARIQGNPPVNFISPKIGSYPFFRKNGRRSRNVGSNGPLQLTDQDVQAKIAYRDLKGNSWEQPLWQILLHVVNHGTHHRGQVSGFLRAMGHNPPALDLIAFYREL